MPEPLQPTLVIPITPDAAGVIPYPSVDFDPSSHYLLHSRIATPPTPWWTANRVDVFAVATLLQLLLAAFILRRIASRPQLPRHLHCVRCNYDLTTAPRSTCPECGADLTRHPPSPGRTRLRRLRLPALTLLPPLLTTSFLTARDLTFSNPGAPWPHPIVGKAIPFWPLGQAPLPSRPPTPVLDLYPLPSGPAIHLAPDTYSSVLFTPDATPETMKLAWLESSEHNNWRLEFVLFTLATRTSARVTLGESSDGRALLHRFTPSGADAIVTITSLTSTDNRGALPVRILAINTTTLAVRELGAASTTATNTGPSIWQAPRLDAAASDTNPPRWALLTLEGPSSHHLITGGPSEPPLTLTSHTLGADGRLVSLPPQAQPPLLPSSITFAPAALPASPYFTDTALSPDGRWYAVVDFNSPPATPLSGEIRLYKLP